MKKKYLLGVMLLPLFSACSSDEPDGVNPEICPGAPVLTLTVEESRAAGQMQGFNLAFFKAVNEEAHADKNVVCSPLSASILLSMLANIADEASASEIASALGSMDVDVLNSLNRKYMGVLPSVDPSVNMALANSVWYQKSLTLNKAFADKAKEFYDTENFSVDFKNEGAAVKDMINNWVKDETKGLITEILGGIEENVVAVLANAMYFKGLWANPFDADRTTKKEFHGANGASVSVDMMYNDGLQHYVYHDDFQAVKMEFGNGVYEAVLVLPAEGVDINDFICGDALKSLPKARFTDCKVELSFPRFSILPDEDVKLRKPLERLGIKSLFKPQGISLFSETIEAAIALSQKVTVEFTEKGAEGASVTWSEVFGSTDKPVATPHMNFNRPFVFFINETTTGAVLFAGKIVEI